MEELAQTLNTWLSGNPWLNLVFLVLAMASVAVTIVLYFAGRREKRPVFNLRNYSLVRRHVRKLSSVQITHNGEAVTDLNLTRTAIWNRGRDTINRGDVAPKDPVRIEVPEGAHVLEATLDFVTSPVNAFSVAVSTDRRTVQVEFDYFHMNEGCVVSIYHTSSQSSPRVLGTIKGVGSFKPAVIHENALLFSFLDRTIGVVIPRERRRRRMWKIVGFMLFLLLTAPILLVSGIESTLRWVRRPPKEFSLQGLD